MPTVGGLLQSAFRVAFQRPGIFFVISLVAHLPYFVLQWLASQTPEEALLSLGVATPLVLASLFLAYILVPLQTGAMVYGVFQQSRGQLVTLGECFSAVLQRLGPLLGVSILMGLAYLAGTLACIIPGLIIQAGFFVAIPVIMVEREVPVIEALKRSWHLTDYAKLTLFVFVLVLGIPSFVVGFLPWWVAMPPVVMAILPTFLQYFFSTISSVGQGIAYQELRNFKEGTEADELVAVFD